MQKSSIISKCVFGFVLHKEMMRIPILIALVLVGCESRSPKESYGLDLVIAMEMSSEELSVINTGAYTKTAVSIPLWINDDEYLARVNYAGATSIDSLKRSFEIHLSKPFRGRTKFRLSAMNGDLSALRALLSFRAFSSNGFGVPQAEPTAVWVNNRYAGLYLLMELYDQDYFESRDIEVVKLYQAENGLGDFKDGTSLNRGFSEKLGARGMGDLETLVSLISAPPSETNCASLAKIVDIDNVMKYMAVLSLIDDQDGCDNNFFLLRTKEEPRFRILPWDLDLSMVHPHDVDDGSLFVENALFSRLYGTESCGHSYLEAYQTAQSILRAQRLDESAADLAESIREAYEHDWFLSSGELTLDDHVAELEHYLSQALSIQATIN